MKLAISVALQLLVITSWALASLSVTADLATLDRAVLLTTPIVTYVVGVWVGRRSTITPSPHP